MTSRGQLITGIKTANEVDGVPCENGAVFEPGIDMRLVAPFRNRRSKQTVEGERGGHIASHDADESES